MLRDLFTTHDTKEKIALIAREYGIVLMVLYGSVARGTETAQSDIDIGILGDNPLSHEDSASIGEEIARELQLPAIEAHSLHHAAPLFYLKSCTTVSSSSPTRRLVRQEFSLYA